MIAYAGIRDALPGRTASEAAEAVQKVDVESVDIFEIHAGIVHKKRNPVNHRFFVFLTRFYLPTIFRVEL